GRARLLLAQLMRRKNVPLPAGEMEPFSPFWVVDFGMFELAEDGSPRLSAVHHPFTAPHPEDMQRLEQILNDIQMSDSPAEKAIHRSKLCAGLRGLHYDLVCDGVELGG